MQPTIAVDIAKDVLEVAVSRFPGKVAERRRLSRTKVLRFFAQRQPSRRHWWGEFEKSEGGARD